MLYIGSGLITSAVLAAAAPATDFTVYGVAGTTVAILLYGIRVLWADNRQLNKDLVLLLEKTTAAMSQSSAQMTESSKALTASVHAIEKVTQMPLLTPDQLYEVASLLREIRGRPRE